MTEEKISRRKLIVGIGSAITATGIGAFLVTNRDDSKPGTSGPENQGQTQAQPGAENIAEYGAEPNPNDPDLATARANLQAIKDAATAAGPGGAVYIPPGTYFVGQDDDTRNIDFGDSHPKGISWYGQSPTESIVALTEHMDKDDSSHVLMYYGNEVDHGTVEFRDIQFFGNAANLDGLHGGETDRSSKAVILTPNVRSGTFNCNNVLFKQWFDGPIRGRIVDWNIDSCTFVENGSESRRRGDSGHSMEFSEGDATVKNTRILRSGSYAIDYRYGNGDLTVENCFVKGYGTGFLKMGAGKSFTVKNTFVRGNTPWIEENYPDKDDRGDEFKGRHFCYSQLSRNGKTKLLRLRNVQFRDCTHEGIKIRRPTKLDADNVSLINANAAGAGEAAISAEGSKAELECLMAEKEITVYDSNKFAINVRSDAVGTGEIGTLYYNDTTKFGNLGGIRIVTSKRPERSCFPIPLESFFAGTSSEAISREEIRSTCRGDSVLTDKKL